MDEGNLVLARKRNESVVIDLRKFGLGLVEVTNIEQRGDKTRLGFKGDKRIPINRREVFEAIERAA
jgi:carbon storage regulator